MTVTLYPLHDAIAVNCPYHPDAIEIFRKLNGTFKGGVWVFDSRDESTVREALVDVYGTDDSASCTDLVDLRLHFEDSYRAGQTSVFLAGRQIARATGRDSGAKLGPGVVVVQGGAPLSGGSMKNWATVIPAGTVLEVRDVPRLAADKLIADPHEGLTVSVVGQELPDLAALQARREVLRKELDEVESMIAGHS